MLSGGKWHTENRRNCRGKPERAPQHVQACRGLPYRMRKPQIWQGQSQFDCGRATGVLDPCARESKARTGRFRTGKLISDHGLFPSYEGQQGITNGQDSWGVFQGYTGFWAAGSFSRVGFASSKPHPSWTSVLQCYSFLYDVRP